jgi:hypothetical protein
MDLRQGAGKIYNKPDVMVVGERLDERQHFLNERIAVSCRAMYRKGANIATHTLDRVAGSQGLAGDLLDDFDCLRRLRGFAPQQGCGTFGVGSYGGKRLIQFMSKTRGEFAQQAPIGDGHHLLEHAVYLRTGPAQLMIVVLHDRSILNRPAAGLSKGLPL